MNQISAWNYQFGVDMPLNKLNQTKSKQKKSLLPLPETVIGDANRHRQLDRYNMYVLNSSRMETIELIFCLRISSNRGIKWIMVTGKFCPIKNLFVSRK